tara:strand:+ start:2046 stop:2240 length:195 start_codon:yes stop_codon:yes gene_type:complete
MMTKRDKELIDAVLDQIAEDVSIEDFTAIEEMFVQIIKQKLEPKQILKAFLDEETLLQHERFGG